MRISDQSNVVSDSLDVVSDQPQLALPIPSLTISSERENQTAPIHPSTKTGNHTDEDPSPPNYEDAMTMSYMSTSLHM